MPPTIITGRLIFAENNSDRLIEKLKFKFSNFDIVEKIIDVPETSIISLLLGIIIILIEYFFKNFKIMRKRNYKYLRTPIMLSAVSFIGLILASEVGIDYAVYGQR